MINFFMAINKLKGFILLTGMGFITALAVGIFLFVELRSILINYSDFSKKIYQQNLDHINTDTLGSMAEYIENQYPVLHDTEKLKEEAGSDWFWQIADDWHKMAVIFKFAYIYYIEKQDDTFIFLMSSGIRRDEHPEWLGGPVWQGPVPAIIEEAWDTKQFTVSPEPTINEWGMLISAELPIITNGKVVGILGIDYDVSYLNSHIAEEKELAEQENALLQRMRNILIIFVLIIIGFMWYQLWVSTRSVLVPIIELEAEQRLQAMVDTMAYALFFFDTDGNLLDCNQKAVTLFGTKNKMELLADFFDFSPEFQPNGRRSIDLALEIIQSAVNNGKEVFRWEHIKKDGTPMPVEVTLTRVIWKDGYRVASYFIDLSELVQTEDNLRRILATAEGSPHPTLFLGSEGNIEYMNSAVPTITGYSREELEKQGLALIFSAVDYEQFSKKYLSAALRGSLTNFEMDVITRHGKIHDFVFSIYAIQMYDGSTGVGLLGRDITELKKMQRELSAAKEQAERALESEVQYNNAKSDFLSRVSHELRTPINAIVGMTEIAKKASEKKEMEQCCEKIEDASQQLLGFVNDILDMTGFDTGKFDFSIGPFSLKKTLDHVIGIITQKTTAKDQEFIASIDNRIPDLVQSDKRRLQQMLLNLLNNAVKFTPEKGKIELSATMVKSDKTECTVRFEIKDNGIGISKEALERIGTIFEQADNSITRRQGGMGLGLSITKCIAEMMNGHIKVESEPGKGSRFICEVKLGIVQEQDNKKEQNNLGTAALENNKAENKTIDLHNKRVLVVDDVDLNIVILSAILEETGVILESAQNGEEAVNQFIQNKFDLILMDLHMPVMDGYTASRKIRDSDIPWAKTIPIISISAESGGQLHENCLNAGITDHLPKPVDVEALFRMISKYMPG